MSFASSLSSLPTQIFNNAAALAAKQLAPSSLSKSSELINISRCHVTQFGFALRVTLAFTMNDGQHAATLRMRPTPGPKMPSRMVGGGVGFACFEDLLGGYPVEYGAA
jgi:hypothetical protein